jgi:hypothetical protein
MKPGIMLNVEAVFCVEGTVKGMPPILVPFMAAHGEMVLLSIRHGLTNA